MILTEAISSDKYGTLLSEPCGNRDATVERLDSDYHNWSERYILKSKDYNRQYAKVYAARLHAVKKRLAAYATKKYGMLLVADLIHVVHQEGIW